jgi:hypothetical protein
VADTDLHPTKPSSRIRYDASPHHVSDAWGLDPFRAVALKHILLADRVPGTSMADEIRRAIGLLEMLLEERGG